MSVEKRVNYDVQGGVKNYLGKQQQVKAPLKWKSSPDSPETELAYITKAEKDLLVKQDLHGSLQGGVNRGPSGIMSLDGYGSFDDPSDTSKDTGMSGAATSDAEAGRTTANTRAEGPGSANLPPGVRDKGLDDYRNAFIAAGGGQRVNPGFFDSRNTVSPAELAAAKAYNPTAFRKTRSGGIMDFITGGGFLGNILRGVGRRLGLGKNYNEPTYNMSGINTRVYENIPGVSTNPTYYNDLDNELMLSTEATPQENKFNYTYDINDLASLIEVSKQPQGSVYDNLNKDPYTYPADTIVQNTVPVSNYDVRDDFYTGDRLKEFEMENGVITKNDERLVAPFRLAKGGIASL